ncbi:hypothetical protein J1N35_025781 [Gossypium stocksii]|uniref:Uncharacterized protein n=1 Tax=Gossypium stocksii TaxID=47602 RepID=A0A9D3V9L4_9ROSI|nr:hypothetical protein J1N35_025781 [Gossypium stocksii]
MDRFNISSYKVRGDVMEREGAWSKKRIMYPLTMVSLTIKWRKQILLIMVQKVDGKHIKQWGNL